MKLFDIRKYIKQINEAIYFSPIMRGKWMPQTEYDFTTGLEETTGYCCSYCGLYYINKHSRCPNCNRRMKR